jgi:hypothetical protein
MQMYGKKQKEQVEVRNYLIRPTLREKFTKNVNIVYIISN